MINFPATWYVVRRALMGVGSAGPTYYLILGRPVLRGNVIVRGIVLAKQ